MKVKGIENCWDHIDGQQHYKEWIWVEENDSKIMKGIHYVLGGQSSDNKVIAISTRNRRDCDRWKDTMPSLEQYSDCIEYLDIDKCRYLVTLNTSIGSLQYLTKLFITRCERLQVLPDSICSLKNLQELVLTDSPRIKSIPQNIGQLSSLTRLVLGGSTGNGNLSLTELPESIGNLMNLQTLILDKCKRLQKIPNSIGQLTNLKYLSARECKTLTSIPTSIGKCKSLIELYLNKCFGLVAIPDSICLLSLLEDLSLAKTSIVSLPHDIGDLTCISHLDVSDCKQLKTIPSSIGKCKELYRLDCSGCIQLKYIPKEIQTLPNLKELIHTTTSTCTNTSSITTGTTSTMCIWTEAIDLLTALKRLLLQVNIILFFMAFLLIHSCVLIILTSL